MTGEVAIIVNLRRVTNLSHLIEISTEEWHGSADACRPAAEHYCRVSTVKVTQTAAISLIIAEKQCKIADLHQFACSKINSRATMRNKIWAKIIIAKNCSTWESNEVGIFKPNMRSQPSGNVSPKLDEECVVRFAEESM